MAEAEAMRPIVPYHPSTYPIYQARANAKNDQIQRKYPAGHTLRGADDNPELTMGELLIERREQVIGGSRTRWPMVPDLGVGGDGHGRCRQYEEVIREFCGVENAAPSLW